MAAGSKQIHQLLDRLAQLPPERVTEVQDFVEFLAAKERADTFAALSNVADQVAAAGIKPMTADEIDAEIKTLRAERRATRS